jgi:hypothetical protein
MKLDYRSLEWQGPYPLKSLDTTRVPKLAGVYTFTNSASPFAFQPQPSLIGEVDNQRAPQIVYVGQALNLSKRIQRHLSEMFPKFMGTYSSILRDSEVELFIYWAVVDDPSWVEEELFRDYIPILNRADVASSTSTFGTASLSTQIERLKLLLSDEVTSEGIYQSYFEENPWVFGLYFTKIEAHQKFDDENIPDFTGIRARDLKRDIIEIKQPFLNLTRTDGNLASEFNEAWNQAERYLDFARQESDYLQRQKQLEFQNPYCYLVIGYDLNAETQQKIERKQRMNPSIIVLSYDQIINMANNTLDFLEQLGGA